MLHNQLSSLSLPDANVALNWLIAWCNSVAGANWVAEPAALVELQAQLLAKPMLVLLRVEQLIAALPGEHRKRLRGCIRVNRKRRRDRALADEKVLLAVDRETYAALLALQGAVRTDTFAEITLNDIIRLTIDGFRQD